MAKRINKFTSLLFLGQWGNRRCVVRQGEGVVGAVTRLPIVMKNTRIGTIPSWRCPRFQDDNNDNLHRQYHDSHGNIWRAGKILHKQQEQQQQYQSSHLVGKRRMYHTTSKQEIVPLIGAAVVVFVMGRYSWRAWIRMEQEWDEYEWKLLQYERQKAMMADNDHDDNNKNNNNTEDHATLVIDFGTIYTKLVSTYPVPSHVLVTREGHRSFFNGILYDQDKKKNNNDMDCSSMVHRRGPAALEHFSYGLGDAATATSNATSTTTSAVVVPYLIHEQEQQSTTMRHPSNLSHVMHDVLSPVLQESVDRLDCSFERYVVTLPVEFLMMKKKDSSSSSSFFHNLSSSSRSSSNKSDTPQQQHVYQTALQETLTYEENPTTTMAEEDEGTGDSSNSAAFADAPPPPRKPIVWIPDAVAAVWGAQKANLLPLFSLHSSPPPAPPPQDDVTTTTTTKKTATMNIPTTVVVIDVGGFITQLSVIQNDVVVHSCSIHLGGETLVQILQQHLAEQAASGCGQSSSLSSSSNNNNNNMATQSMAALLQVHARTAVSELATKPQTPIHIPYLFFVGTTCSTNSQDNPNSHYHHFDYTISRSVLEELVQGHIASRTNDFAYALSPHLPQPTNLSALFTSLFTQLLEQSNVLPFEIDHVLLIGGASRFPLIRQSLQQSLDTLLGMSLSGGGSGSGVPSSSSQEEETFHFLIIPDDSLVSELVVLGASTVPPNYEYNLQTGLQRITPQSS